MKNLVNSVREGVKMVYSANPKVAIGITATVAVVSAAGGYICGRTSGVKKLKKRIDELEKKITEK